MKDKNSFLSGFLHLIIFSLLLTSCGGQSSPAAFTMESEAGNLANAEPTAAETQAPAPQSILPLAAVFSIESRFCAPEPDRSAFSSICADGNLLVRQNENRRRQDILFYREIPVKYNAPFKISFDATSQPFKENQKDQNQYGVWMIDGLGNRHVLRIQSQYFSWETWVPDGALKISERYNPSFSTFINPAGKENKFNLNCSDTACMLQINNTTAANLPTSISKGLYALGIFAESAWDEQFGSVGFHNFSATALSEDPDALEMVNYSNDLSVDTGFFAKTGLSGAYNSFDQGGFHFSPVIPYGYYAVKSNSAYADVSISAVVDMEIDPGKSASQYGGLICRASQDGMYMAVIRADGTYTIYRDTPQRPWAMLAEHASEFIRAGSAENTLRLDCIGQEIQFFINGHLVETLKDTRYDLRFGRIGFYTKAGGSPDPDAIIFKDLMVEEK